ncbi:hypothetical protein PsYK624_029790 [Phanerochaete sordida]|uniref:F-box domain-containing protein n=1 Tax=Phanerochaete sordida TaxID=48140 RepID=A0A9P3G280_9APHY|nr:hypothetical protein PsYK624_029790 [Phanerochaete sordida]
MAEPPTPAATWATVTAAAPPLFKDTPLDIVYEVLSHLEPGDILNLARTSRPLRKMLMTRRSAHLWRKARENIGANIPAPPDYMSEPRLANLLVCMHCHKCLQEVWTDDIFWELSARLCGQCMDYERPDFTMDMPLRDAIELFFGDDTDFGPVPEHLRLDDTRMLSEFVPTIVSNEFFERHRALHMRYKDVAAFVSRMNVIGDRERVLAYLEEQASMWLSHREYMMQFMASYDAWQAFKRKRASTRLRSAIERLKNEGWEAEFQCYTTSKKLSRHPAVDRTHPLYEHEWKMIRPQILEVMEEAKRERLEQERIDSISNRIAALASVLQKTQCLAHNWPLTADVALGVPRVHELLTLPTDATVDAAAFDFLPELLQAWIPSWRAQAAAGLAQLVQETVGEIADGVDPLDLAVGALFLCIGCNSAETFPQVLTHTTRCRRWRMGLLFQAKAADDAGVPRASFSSAAWHESCVVRPIFRLGYWQAKDFTAANAAVLRRLVELYGLDPRHATIRDMDTSPVRLAVSVEAALKVMDWISAYEHCTTAVAQDIDATSRSDIVSAELAKLFVLPAQLCTEARPLEERYTTKRLSGCSDESDNWWACTHCDYNVETLPESEMRLHVKGRHGEEHPSRMQDYVPTLSSYLTRRTLAPVTYLISQEYEGDVRKLPTKVLKDALDAGTAAFSNIASVL